MTCKMHRSHQQAAGLCNPLTKFFVHCFCSYHSTTITIPQTCSISEWSQYSCHTSTHQCRNTRLFCNWPSDSFWRCHSQHPMTSSDDIIWWHHLCIYSACRLLRNEDKKSNTSGVAGLFTVIDQSSSDLLHSLCETFTIPMMQTAIDMSSFE